MKKYFIPCCFTLLLSTVQTQKTIGSIEILDAALTKVILPRQKLSPRRRLSMGRRPCLGSELEAVLFTDVLKTSPINGTNHGLTPYLDPSGYTAIAPNEKNRVERASSRCCWRFAYRTTRRSKNCKNCAPLKTPSAFETVVGKYQGKFFNSPNDLVLSKRGTSILPILLMD